MLDIWIEIKNEKAVINNIGHLAAAFPDAVRSGMSKSAKGIFRAAFKFLSGAKEPAGAFPVPVKTGHLRRMLDWLEPGQSKTTEDGSITAGDFEVIVYDSAAYATVIAKGWGSSAKFGERDYLVDAFNQFNEGERIARTVAQEVEKIKT